MYAIALMLSLMGTPDDKAKAEEHLQRGNDLLDEGLAEAAIVEYKRAEALYPSPRLHYNFGCAHDNAGRPREALSAFERFVELVGPLPESSEEAISRKLVDARKRIPQLRKVLAVVEPGLSLPGTELTRPKGNQLGVPTPPVQLSRPFETTPQPATSSTSRLKWWLGGIGVVAAGAATTWYFATRGNRRPCTQTFCPF